MRNAEHQNRRTIPHTQPYGRHPTNHTTPTQARTNQVIDAELLQRQHHVREIGPARVGAVQHVQSIIYHVGTYARSHRASESRGTCAGGISDREHNVSQTLDQQRPDKM